jgi:hypothetical protein
MHLFRLDRVSEIRRGINVHHEQPFPCRIDPPSAISVGQTSDLSRGVLLCYPTQRTSGTRDVVTSAPPLKQRLGGGRFRSNAEVELVVRELSVTV